MQQTTSDQRQQRTFKTWAGRLAGMLIGVLMAWLLIEVLLRLFFFSLPPRLQLVLNSVHVTPFTDKTLLPAPIWQSDVDYLTIARPVQNYEQFGSAEVRFEVTTETLWGSRAAFRTRQELVDQRVDGIAVGDSFTFCFTDTEDCWVQQLSAKSERNIINFGIVSTGSVSHQRILETFGMPLQAPLVLWQWYGNDANEDYGLAQLRGETTVESTAESVPERSWTWWDQNSALYVVLKLLVGNDDEFEGSLQFLDPEYAEDGDVQLAFGQPYLWGAFDMSLPPNQDGWERSQQAFLEAQDMVTGYGGSLVILLMPTKEQVYRDMSEPLLGTDKLALLDESRQLMLEFCAEENLTCIDLLPIFQAHTDEQIYYTTDIHLNARGNELLAETLAVWLEEHNIFKNISE